jgi:hypothetical protein
VKEKLFYPSSNNSHATIKIYLPGNRFAVGKSTAKQIKNLYFCSLQLAEIKT